MISFISVIGFLMLTLSDFCAVVLADFDQLLVTLSLNVPPEFFRSPPEIIQVFL